MDLDSRSSCSSLAAKLAVLELTETNGGNLLLADHLANHQNKCPPRQLSQGCESSDCCDLKHISGDDMDISPSREFLQTRRATLSQKHALDAKDRPEQLDIADMITSSSDDEQAVPTTSGLQPDKTSALSLKAGMHARTQFRTNLMIRNSRGAFRKTISDALQPPNQITAATKFDIRKRSKRVEKYQSTIPTI
jgi:hypothetical protein